MIAVMSGLMTTMLDFISGVGKGSREHVEAFMLFKMPSISLCVMCVNLENVFTGCRDTFTDRGGARTGRADRMEATLLVKKIHEPVTLTITAVTMSVCARFEKGIYCGKKLF